MRAVRNVTFLLIGFLPYSVSAQDLIPLISDVSITAAQSVDPGDLAEGCAGGLTGRTLLRFTHTVRNDGPGNLSLGAPDCPDCFESPGAICANPIFMCSGAGGHMHPHISEFSSYTVFKSTDPTVLRTGHKEGFCLLDSVCDDGITPAVGDCNQLTAGCSDIYGTGLGCQYVDITDLPAGNYTLRVDLNPTAVVSEINYLNNTAVYDFTVSKIRKGLAVYIGAPTAAGNGLKSFSLTGTVHIPAGITVNPLKDGLPIRLLLDGSSVFDMNIPAGGRLSGCGVLDGWKKLSRDKWRYKNISGYTDPTCFQSANGVEEITVTREKSRLDVTLKGKVPVYVAPRPPKSGIFRVPLGDFALNDTYLAATLQRCRFSGKTYGIRCR